MRRLGLMGLTLAGVLGGLVAGGCALPSRETIQVAYADELDQLEPGMPVERFRSLIPEADQFQRTYTAAGTISVYRLDHLYKQADDVPATTQSLYFRFVEGKLDRWGYSSTWGQGP